MAADLVTIATTAVLTQFLTPAAKNLGEVALERAKRIGSKAMDYLVAVGRETQPVEEKVLYPLLQAASLESDPTLAEKWAALLANAADPAQRISVHPSYSDVLRLLTSDDAQVLGFIYEWQMADDDTAFDEESTLTIATIFSHFEWPGSRLELSLDNLLRLRLFEETRPTTYGGIPARELSRVMPTVYGGQFMLAVTPPKP